MANHKSKQYPYKWPDGSYHSRPAKGGGGSVTTRNNTVIGNPKFTPPVSGPQLGAGGPAANPEDPRFTAWFNNSQAGDKASLDNTRLDIGTDVVDAGKDYGFTSGGKTDQYGNTTYGSNFGVDPSNPFSKMALLQHSYQQQKAGTLNSYASGGQLNSGAYQRMKRENQFGNDNATYGLQKAFQDILKNASRGNRDAGANYNSATSGNALQALQMSLGS